MGAGCAYSDLAPVAKYKDFPYDETDRGPPMDSELAALFNEVAGIVEMGVWSWDVVTGETWWSKGLYRINGRDPARGPTRDHELKYVHEDDRERVREAIERSLEEGPYYVRCRLIRSDGCVRLLDSFGRTYFEDGEPRRLIGIAFDITERTRANELAEFRARLLDTVGQALIATDASGTIVYANRSVEEMFGWKPEELIGQHVVDGPVTLKEYEARATEIVSAVFAGETWQGEATVSRRDGTIFPALLCNYPVFDDDGQVVGLIGVATDITAQKRSEVAALEGETLYRALFESSGLFISLLEADGTVVMVNEATATYLGVPAEQAVGRRTDELYPAAHSLLKSRIEEVLARGEPVVFEDTWIEPDGARYYVTNISPVELAERTLLQCAANDLTVLRETELALRESERQRLHALEDNRAFYEKAPTMIHSIDASGRLTKVSDYWLDKLGYTRAEVLGRPSIDLLTPASRENAIRWIKDYLTTGSLEDRPLQMVKKSGEIMDVLLSATSEFNERGELARSFTVLTDMTEQRRLERERLELARQLEYAQKLESLGVLAGGIAHDFNNLLTVILGNVELADAHTPSDSPARKYLANIEEATKRASSLAGEMLAYSGKGNYVVKPLDLSREVKAIMNLLRTMIARTTKLEYKLSEELPQVSADVAQLQQVITNLVINASEALQGDTGVVAVRTFARTYSADEKHATYVNGALGEGPYVCLEVRDNGCGMDHETQRRMFDPFYTTKTSGRGLGLAALQGIVRGHDGVVMVESARGRGTTITVCLPPVASPASADEAPRPHDVSPGATGATELADDALILFVDDEPELRSLGQDLLRSFGYRSLLAADGREALTMFMERRDDIALVLLDLTMPQMSGAQTFAAIRAIEPSARIILTSGYSENQFVKGVVDDPLVMFIQKPFRLTTLRAAIKGLLRA